MPRSHPHVKAGRPVRATQDNFTRNWVGRGYLVAVTGSTWLLRGLRGCYGVCVAVKASMWLLWGLCGCYGVYVAVKGSMWLLWGLCGCYGVYVAVTGSMWLLWGLRGSYGVYVAVTGSILLWGKWLLRGSTWLLRGLCPAISRENCITWLLRDKFYVKVWPRHKKVTTCSCAIIQSKSKVNQMLKSPDS